MATNVHASDGSAAEQAQAKAQEIAGQTQEKVQQAADQARQQAQQVTGQARDKLREQVDQRSTQAGDQVAGQAGDLRSVAEGLREQGKDKPAKLAEQAADRSEQAAAYLRDADADRILRDVEDFARRKPMAVVGGGIALGFAASRFLKASSADRYGQSAAQPSTPAPLYDPGYGLRGDEPAGPAGYPGTGAVGPAVPAVPGTLGYDLGGGTAGLDERPGGALPGPGSGTA